MNVLRSFANQFFSLTVEPKAERPRIPTAEHRVKPVPRLMKREDSFELPTKEAAKTAQPRLQFRDGFDAFTPGRPGQRDVFGGRMAKPLVDLTGAMRTSARAPAAR